MKSQRVNTVPVRIAESECLQPIREAARSPRSVLIDQDFSAVRDTQELTGTERTVLRREVAGYLVAMSLDTERPNHASLLEAGQRVGNLYAVAGVRTDWKGEEPFTFEQVDIFAIAVLEALKVMPDQELAGEAATVLRRDRRLAQPVLAKLNEVSILDHYGPNPC